MSRVDRSITAVLVALAVAAAVTVATRQDLPEPKVESVWNYLQSEKS